MECVSSKVSIRHPNGDTDQLVGNISLEFRRDIRARETNFASIGIQMVFKVMRLDAITKKEYVEILWSNYLVLWPMFP